MWETLKKREVGLIWSAIKRKGDIYRGNYMQNIRLLTYAHQYYLNSIYIRTFYKIERQEKRCGVGCVESRK